MKTFFNKSQDSGQPEQSTDQLGDMVFMKPKKPKRRLTFFGVVQLKHLWLALFAFLFAGTVIGYNFSFANAQKDFKLSPDVKALAVAMVGKNIVIDPGHGGFDPGAIGISGTKEKDVNLAVAKRLVSYLKQAGANVTETRTSDKAVGSTKKEDMHNRVKIAEDSQADVFISVQANSIPQAKWRGAQVFYHKGSPDGQALATQIQTNFKEILQNTDRVAMPIKDVFVVRSLNIPSIVVEVGFLSNPEEEALLSDPEYQNQLAYSIFLGIVEYYSQAIPEDQAPTPTQPGAEAATNK